MIARQSDTFRSLLRVASGPAHGEPPDAELLRRFASDGDRDAFAALVRRYAPLVHGLCARILNHRQDAEDATQATFLVLSTKARTLAPTTALAGWLYGVAHRTARKLVVGNARRRTRERAVTVRTTPDPAAELSVREAQSIIDEELANLPDRLRAPLVLCALDGLTRDEAARRLGWTVAAVKDRLEQARARLRARLTRRGLVLPAAGLSLLILGNGATAAVPAGFIDSTVRAAERLALGTLTPDALSPAVRALLDGGLRPMTLVKLHALVGLVLVVGLAAGALSAPEPMPGAGGGASAEPKPGAAPAAPKAGAAELQGTWTLTETHTRGKKTVAANVWLEPPTLVIAGNRVTLLTHPGSEEGTVEADPRAKPKEYTFNFKKPEVGVYAVDGDSLKLCFNPANGIRPTDFATPPDSDRVLAVYKREPAVKEGGMMSDPKPGAGGPPKAGADVPAKTDLQKLQGTWVLDETRFDGKVVVDNRQGLIAHSKIEIDGHSFTMHLLDGGSGHLHSKLQIKEAADPKRITFDWYGGQAHGVYTLDGDTFQFCYVPGAKEPPAKVGAPAGSKAVLLVYKRQPRAKDEGKPEPVLFKGHTAPIYAAAFSADRSTLATASGDKTVKVWDVRTRKERATIPAQGGVLLSADGRTLATVEADRAGSRSVRLWDTTTGRQVGEPVPGGATALSPDGRTLALYDGWNYVLWDVPAARARATLAAEIDNTLNRIADGKQFTDLTFSPDGKTAATTTADRTVVVWDVATGKKLTTIAGHAVAWPIYPQKDRNESRLPPVLTAAEQKQLAAANAAANFRLAYAPDGRTLATARGGEVRLWDVRTGREAGKFPAPTADVTHLGFSADGATLTAASQRFVPRPGGPEPFDPYPTQEFDVTVAVRQWDVKTGRESRDAALSLKCDARLWFAVFSPDLTKLAVPAGNAVRVWDAAALPQPVPAKKNENPRREKSVSGVVTAVSASSVTVGGESHKLTKDTRYLLESGLDPWEVGAKELVKGRTVDLVVVNGVVVRVFIWQHPLPEKKDPKSGP